MDNFLKAFEDVVNKAGGILWEPFLVFLLLGVGIQFSIRLGLFQISKIKLWLSHTIFTLFKKDKTKKEQNNNKTISSFQAVTAALAGCVGTGNIVGVATAITLGGPGALFWMWIAAFFGMMTIFAENVLGIKYKTINKLGEPVGGPMYYIKEGIPCKWLAKVLTSMFCISCIFVSFGTGNMAQSHSISSALKEGLGFSQWIVGIIVAAISAVIIFGGIVRIAQVTEKLIPFMTLFYIVGGLIVIIFHIDKLPKVFDQIIASAFNFRSAAGGAAGFVITNSAMRYGMSRGIISNEAGIGSSPIVHSVTGTNEPVIQGMWGIFQVFIDTLVVCTLTALCILSSGVISTGKEGVALSVAAFSTVFGKYGELFICFSLLLFAFSTLVSWSFYGEKCTEYLAGVKYVPMYKAAYILMIFLGSIMELRLIWALGDIFVALMAIPNLIALVILSGKVADVTKKYLKKVKVKE